jgi:hypothetical protein
MIIFSGLIFIRSGVCGTEMKNLIASPRHFHDDLHMARKPEPKMPGVVSLLLFVIN